MGRNHEAEGQLATAPPEPENIIEREMVSYLNKVGALGVVTEVIVGFKPGEPARLFNVVTEDFSRARARDLRYKKLRHYATQLEDTLRKTVPLFASSVNPSQLEGFLADCKLRGIDLQRHTVSRQEPG